MSIYLELAEAALAGVEKVVAPWIEREAASLAVTSGRAVLSTATREGADLAKLLPGEAALPSAARALTADELSQIALGSNETVPTTLADFPKLSLIDKIESALNLSAVRDLALQASDSSLPWETGSNLLGKRAAMLQDISKAKSALPNDIAKSLIDRQPRIITLLESRPADLSECNKFLEKNDALKSFDEELDQLARGRARSLQLSMRPTFARLDLPMPKFFSSEVQLGARAAYTDGAVTMGRNFFLQPVDKKSGALLVHEVSHFEQFYLMACREADKLGIRLGRATVNQLDALSQNLSSTETFTQSTIEKFLAHRNGKQLSSAAANRADQLMNSVENFVKYPVGQVEVESQAITIDKFQSLLAGSDNINISKSLISNFHDPLKGIQTARAIFGASEAESERALLTSTFPKRELATWTAKKDATATEFLRGAFDRAEIIVNRLHSEVFDNYFNSLHEREARFYEFVAKQVLNLHLS